MQSLLQKFTTLRAQKLADLEQTIEDETAWLRSYAEAAIKPTQSVHSLLKTPGKAKGFKVSMGGSVEKRRNDDQTPILKKQRQSPSEAKQKENREVVDEMLTEKEGREKSDASKKRGLMQKELRLPTLMMQSTFDIKSPESKPRPKLIQVEKVNEVAVLEAMDVTVVQMEDKVIEVSAKKVEPKTTTSLDFLKQSLFSLANHQPIIQPVKSALPQPTKQPVVQETPAAKELSFSISNDYLEDISFNSNLSNEDQTVLMLHITPPPKPKKRPSSTNSISPVNYMEVKHAVEQVETMEQILQEVIEEMVPETPMEKRVSIVHEMKRKADPPKAEPMQITTPVKAPLTDKETSKEIKNPILGGLFGESPVSLGPTTILLENGEFPNIDTRYPYQSIGLDLSGSESDTEKSVLKKKNATPLWAHTPNLIRTLQEQYTRDPDAIFGNVKPCSLEDIFKGVGDLRKLKVRSSSANWTGVDKLSGKEIEAYRTKMGFEKK